MRNITNERTWEMLNLLINKMIEDEGRKENKYTNRKETMVLCNLINLGFTRDEIIELNSLMELGLNKSKR